jgi:site-specific DNA-cytosine methylase
LFGTNRERLFLELQKLDNEAPSPTLASGAHLLTHWSQPRLLTFREWKRLGSFPDDYQARNERIGKYIVGMSVPPKMMYEVVNAVIQQWLG